MKILSIGDVHFKVQNTIEIEQYILKIEQKIIELQPTLIVVLGDILDTHERIHTTVMNKAFSFIDMLKKYATTYVLVGNHDMINNQQFLTTNHWLNSMKKWENVFIVDNVHSLKIENISFVFVPYVPNGRFIEALNTSDNWVQSTIIFAHQEFRGCNFGHILSEQGDIWDISYPLIISGHIHNKQQPQTNIRYIGASMQTTFGEDENPSIVLSTISDTIVHEEIFLCLPSKKTILLTVEEAQIYQYIPSENRLKIVITGLYTEFKTFKKTPAYKKLNNNSMIKIMFKPISIPILTPQCTGFIQVLQSIIENSHDTNLTKWYLEMM